MAFMEAGVNEQAEREVAACMVQMRDVKTAEDINAVVKRLSGLDVAPALQHEISEAIRSGRERVKRLRLAQYWPVYAVAAELPDDFPPFGQKKYSAHTVLLVDTSGSMRSTDVATEAGAPISRVEAVRRVLLETFLRGQLVGGGRPTERVSLIKIQPEGPDESAMPFALFPLDTSLAEHISHAVSEPRSHGPYLPALRRLRRLLSLAQPYFADHATTSVLFLSDGRPSDQVDERELAALIKAELAPLVGLERFQLLGFGDADERTLQMMAEAVPGRVGTFDVISGPGGYTSLAQSVSTFSSSVAVSRISSVSAIAHQKQLRRLRHAPLTGQLDMYLYPDCDIELPPKRLGDFLGELLPLRGVHNLYIASTMLGHGGEVRSVLPPTISAASHTLRSDAPSPTC